MRIGIIVDGQAEYRSLTRMFPRIGGEATVVRPLHADLQPKASTAKLIRAALPSVRILARKNVQRIVMVLDHEGRPGCVLMWRSQLEAALNQPCKRAGVTDVKVVFKCPFEKSVSPVEQR